MTRSVPFISRVRLRNYKSIAECDVRLGPLTLLVGPNGSGKSNFLDALAFLARALSTTPYEAINERGGLNQILRRVPDPADSFEIQVEATVGWPPKGEQPMSASYGVEIGSSERHGLRQFEVIQERCSVQLGQQRWEYDLHDGVVRDNASGLAGRDIQPDRLYLPLASTDRQYMSLFALLSGMEFYALSLDVLRQPLPPLQGASLDRRGEHLGDVLEALAVVRPEVKKRLDAYLAAIAPGVEGMDGYSVGGYIAVALRTRPAAEAKVIEFGPAGTSDGTIRAAGVLAALFQLGAFDGRIPVVGIEEPEVALHPAAAGVLFDALTEASQHVQVIATSQSPDLLDRDDLDVSAVRAVSLDHGLTIIGEVDAASRQITSDKLYTLGELMRSNQLRPEPASEVRTQTGN